MSDEMAVGAGTAHRPRPGSTLRPPALDRRSGAHRQVGAAYCHGVEGEALRRAVDAAMVPMVASLGGAGVLDAHWLPDRDGQPVVWLKVRTELQRVELQAQPWLHSQVQILLTRLAVPYSVISRLRLEFTSVEAEEDLFDG